MNDQTKLMYPDYFMVKIIGPVLCVSFNLLACIPVEEVCLKKKYRKTFLL